MTQGGTLRKALDKFMQYEDRKLLNVSPQNLPEISNERSYNKLSWNRNFIKKTAALSYITIEEKIEEFNIVFLGLYGADKNKLINQLFNQEILSSWTDHRYLKGEYLGRRIKVVATIDLCGPSIKAQQVGNIIEDSLKAWLVNSNRK